MPERWVWVCRNSSESYSDWRLETLCDYAENYDDDSRKEYIFGKEEA